MKTLRRLLDSQARHFEPGGKLQRFYAIWEAQDTFLFSPGSVTAGASHVRDGLDLKTPDDDGGGCSYRLYCDGVLQHGLSGESRCCSGRGSARHMANRTDDGLWYRVVA